ncbi:30S ribosomal protein S15 [Candidatus Micrarchaeota archaeon]|nr:30S ribosomal protein S15 [Candidatus Micrarchaeota archaeon]
MAKLHSKKRGKSKSRKPLDAVKPEGVNDEEIKELIINLAKQGTSPSVIGTILRDEHGIGDVRLVLGGKRLSTFLKEQKVAGEYPEDLLSLIKKAVKMREHLKSKGSDKHNKVKLSNVESKIHRLVKYYKKEKVLPSGWKYDPESAALLVR